MKPRIAISLGDYNGIGTEVVLKTLADPDTKNTTPVILGSSHVVDFYIEKLGIDISYHTVSSSAQIKDDVINLYEVFPNGLDENIHPGEISENAGACAMKAVEKGIQLCMKEKTHALVTAPISKEAVNEAGYNIPGHTEFLAEKTNCPDYMMMLVNNGLRVGLVTIHVPISQVPRLLTIPNVWRYIRILNKSLKNDFNIKKPAIAVLGLNPHAGEGGVIGDEEIRIIGPAIRKAQQNDLNVDGPFAADGFFGNRMYKKYDAILAMYHDQGLVPFKTLSFNSGVNFTAGLPIIRTSPDHGTAFDIAGKNKASNASFKKAYLQAAEMAHNRIPAKQKA